MRISPIDIRQQDFKKKFKGYDPEEVTSYLDIIATELEELNLENSSLKSRLKKSDEELTSLKKNETSVKEMLGAIQDFKRNVSKESKKEADLLIKEAKIKGFMIYKKSQDKLLEIEKDIEALGLQKKRFISSLKNLAEEQLRTLVTFEENE